MAHPGDLTDRATVQAYLSPPVSNPNFLILDACISASSGMVKKYLNRDIAAKAYVETRNGTGMPVMRVFQYPIIQLTQVRIGSAIVPPAQPEFSASSTTNGGGWVNDTSMVYLRAGLFGLRTAFTSGFQNVQFSYTAGYTTPGQIVCENLPSWQAGIVYPATAQILQNGFIYTNISTVNPAMSGTSMPVFPTSPIGARVSDGSVIWKLVGAFTGIISNADIVPDDIILATTQQAVLLFKQRDRVGDEGSGVGDERMNFFMGPLHKSTKLLLDLHRDITPVGDI